MVKMFP